MGFLGDVLKVLLTWGLFGLALLFVVTAGVAEFNDRTGLAIGYFVVAVVLFAVVVVLKRRGN